MTESTLQLTTAIASGDTEAFARFYEAWFDAMYEESRRWCPRDESMCMDVMQDAMMRIIRSMKPLEEEASLHRWAMLAVRSAAFDVLRCESRRKRRECKSALGPSDLAPANCNPERMAWLRRELASMSAEEMGLLLMRHRFGWTLKRIGATLGLSAGAVDGRLMRITRRLRDRAEEACHDDA